MNCTDFWNYTDTFKKAYDVHNRRVMQRFGMSAAEVDVLMFLANNPTLNTAADIVRLRSISKAHVSLAVSALEERGFVEKRCDAQNRRKLRLTPTAQAAEVIDYARAERGKLFAVMFRGFTPEEFEQFRRALSRVTDNVCAEYGAQKRMTEEQT